MFPIYNILKRKTIAVSDFIAYYPFNGNADDESGNGNNGTNNGATLTTDRFSNANSAFDLDGINDFIDIDTVVDDVATTTVGSWTEWVEPFDATPASQEMLITFSDKSDVNEGIFAILLTSGILRVQQVNAGAVVQWQVETDSAVFSDGTWNHIGIVQDGIEAVLYIDAVAVPQTFSITTDKTAWFNDLTDPDTARIGNRNINSTEKDFFDGKIDDVRIYDRDLSAAEVLEIYNSEKP